MMNYCVFGTDKIGTRQESNREVVQISVGSIYFFLLRDVRTAKKERREMFLLFHFHLCPCVSHNVFFIFLDLVNVFFMLHARQPHFLFFLDLIFFFGLNFLI